MSMETKQTKEQVEKLKAIQSKVSDEKAKKAIEDKIKGFQKPVCK